MAVGDQIQKFQGNIISSLWLEEDIRLPRNVGTHSADMAQYS